MARRSQKLKHWLNRTTGLFTAFIKNKRALLGLLIIAFFAFLGIFAPLLTPFHPTLDIYLSGSGERYAQPSWFRYLPGGDTLSENLFPIIDPEFAADKITENWNFQVSSQFISVEKSGVGQNGSALITFTRKSTATPEVGKTRISVPFEYPYSGPPARFTVNVKILIEGDANLPVEPIVFIDDNTDQKNYTWGFSTLPEWEEKNFTGTSITWISPNPPITSHPLISLRSKFFGTESQLGKLVFPKAANYSLGLDIVFWDLPSNAGKNVKAMVYVDVLNLKLYGTAFGILGCDWEGRDIFTQLIYGARISLYVGLLAAGISVFLGLIIGLVAGYIGGLIDEGIMRLTDALLVLPGLPLLIVLIAVLGTSINNIIIIIGFLGWMGFARVVRSQVLSLKERPFIEAAKAVGAGKGHIIFTHIIPNVMSLVYVTLATSVPAAIVAEAALAWLGYFDPYIMSWGRMLNEVQGHSGYKSWWWVLPPGLAIAAISVSFILLGYALDEILNPRLRIRR